MHSPLIQIPAGPFGIVPMAVTLTMLIVWITVLMRVMKRNDLDGTTKICWVIILCSLNILGLFLYAIFGPKSSPSA